MKRHCNSNSNSHKKKRVVQKQQQQDSRKKDTCNSLHVNTGTGTCTPPTPPSLHPYTQQNTSIQNYRNLSKLYTCRDTFVCATRHACIPCSYKIGTFDVALDMEFTRSVPNIRPEMCKRMQDNSTLMMSSYSGYYGYMKGMNILTVGDGDFSFSLALARILLNQSTAKSKIGKEKNIEPCLVATSYESFDTLHRVYPDIQKTLDELEKLNVQVCFNVDATDLLGTLPTSIQTGVSSFHRIVWNFPCTAIADGQDGQNQQMQDNQILVKKFVKQCKRFLHPISGEIHFMHKTKPPYDQWKLEEIVIQEEEEEEEVVVVVVEDLDHKDDNHLCDEAKKSNDYPSCPLVYMGRIVFDRCLLMPYIPRKALDKKSFPCHDACLFVFGWKDTVTKNSKEIKRNATNNKTGRDVDHPIFPSTIPLGGPSQDDAVLPVTKQVIDEIRVIQMTLGSYKERKSRQSQVV